MKYRKKPVVVEAMQWTGLNLEEVKDFVGEALTYDIIDDAWKVGKGRPHVLMKIKTLEGDMEVSEKDYIIKGVNGEFYPCKPDIFQKTYAPESTEDKPIGRLIDADAFERSVMCSDAEDMQDVIYALRDYPTAYDLDKVAEELEGYRKEMEQFGCSGMLSDMIEVVKGGGVNGNFGRDFKEEHKWCRLKGEKHNAD